MRISRLIHVKIVHQIVKHVQLWIIVPVAFLGIRCFMDIAIQRITQILHVIFYTVWNVSILNFVKLANHLTFYYLQLLHWLLHHLVLISVLLVHLRTVRIVKYATWLVLLAWMVRIIAHNVLLDFICLKEGVGNNARLGSIKMTLWVNVSIAPQIAMIVWTRHIANHVNYKENLIKVHVMILVQMEHMTKAKFALIAQVHVKNVTVLTLVHNVKLLMYYLKTNVYLTAHQELILA